MQREPSSKAAPASKPAPQGSDDLVTDPMEVMSRLLQMQIEQGRGLVEGFDDVAEDPPQREAAPQ